MWCDTLREGSAVNTIYPAKGHRVTFPSQQGAAGTHKPWQVSNEENDLPQTTLLHQGNH